MTTRPNCVIFIDFDGVTHPVPGRVPDRLDDPEMGTLFFRGDNLREVNRLLSALDAVGVVASSWKLLFPWQNFQAYFQHRLVGQTPELGPMERHAECCLFLERQGWQDLPWLAVDDKPIYYSPKATLIAPDPTRGLVAADVDAFLARR